MDGLAAELPMKSGRSKDQDMDTTREATKGQDDPVKWIRVATVGGQSNASIVAGRLEVNGIPTRVTQEAAGVHAFAVNVGILGSAHIWVPEEYQEQAEDILAYEWNEEEE